MNSDDLLTGTLAPFEFLEPIGEGGMGKLWRGRHRQQLVDVAIKFIQPSRLESDRAQSMFRREAHAMALLNHRSILSIYDYGELSEDFELPGGVEMRAGSPYLVMDYASGGNLRERPAPRSWNELHSVLRQILDGLAHAHARSLYHRDLKPENIVAKVRQTGTHLQLTDFGLAYISQVDSDTVERELSSAGTPSYMAPEQIKADWRRVGPWTDLYSVGVLAFELSTGQLPFGGKTAVDIMMGHLNEPVPIVAPRFPVPSEFMNWTHRLLSKLPEGRFQTAVHAIRELDEMEPPYAPAPPVLATPSAELQDSETLLQPTTTQRLATIESNTTLHFEPFASDSREVAPLPPFPVFDLPRSWVRTEAPPPVVLTGAGLGLFGVRDLGLVGREAERDALWQDLHDVREQQSPLLTLVRAPSGRGASSVASWTVRRSGELGAFEVVDLGAGTRYALEFLLGTRDLHGDERVNALQKSLEQVGRPDLVRPAASVIAGTRGARPDRVLASYIEARAKTRPMAVLIDDAHDELASLTLIRNLLEREGPIAIIAVIRDDDLAENLVANEIVYHLSVHPRTSTLEVGPLSDPAMRAMIRRLIPLDPLDLERVVEASSGNPRFATEALRDWVKRGVLVPRDSWYFAEGTLDIPDKLHRPWKQRVTDFLAFYDENDLPAVRYTLEIGAFLGPEVLRADWDLGVELADVEVDKFFLNEAGEARLLEGDMQAGRFTHPMLRYSLMRIAEEEGRSKAANRICAQVIEMLHGDEGDAASLRLARHLMDAGEPGRALALATEVIESSQANDFALALRAANVGQRAIESLELPVSEPRRFRLETLVVTTIYHMNLERAEARVERLLEVMDQVSDELRAGALLAAGTVLAARARVQDATDRLTEAVDLYHELGEVAGEAWARCRRGYLYRWTNDNERALEELEHVLEMVESGGVPQRTHAVALTGLGMLRHATGRPGAIEALELALAVLPDSDTRQRATTKSELAEVLRKRGEYELAAELYEEAIAYFEAHGSAMWLVNQANLAMCHAELGDWDRVAEIAEATVVDARRQAIPIVIVVCGLLLALAVAHLGEEPRFRVALDMALEELEGAEYVDPDITRLLEEIAAAVKRRGWDESTLNEVVHREKNRLERVED